MSPVFLTGVSSLLRNNIDFDNLDKILVTKRPRKKEVVFA